MITQHKKQLRAKSQGSGGIYWRTDFHIHLPGSDDYEYKGNDAFAQMGKALTDGGYGLAVILKHQEFPTKEELAELKSFCPNTTLIPGAEINVFVDALSKKVTKDHFFHCIVAADPESPYQFLLHKAKESLSYKEGEYPAGFQSSIRDVARLFTSEGALFIPAHLHQSKPPQNSRSIDDIYDDDAFLDFVGSGVFSALEVREKGTASFFDGETETQDGTTIPAAVCVQSSDAHSHQHLIDRKRSTWVQMETPTFAELRSAISFRHRIRLESPTFDHGRVLGLHVKGSFLQDEWVAFNPGINCLIGCKGSGKTSILECLRFVLSTEVPPEREDSVKSHIQHILGPAGYVECLVRHPDGREILLVRRADSPDRIKVVDESGTSHEIEAQRGSEFKISILGWHEIEAVADRASARVRLVDRVQGEDAIRGLYSQIDDNVEAARDLLPELQRKLKRLGEKLKKLWLLQNKRRTLQKLEEGALLLLQSQYERFVLCEQELKSFETQVREAANRIKETSESAYEFLGTAEKQADNIPDAVKTANTEIEACEAVLEQRAKSVCESVEKDTVEVLKTIRDQSATITTAFRDFRQLEYEPKVNALPPEDREILGRQIQIIEETKRLPVIEQECRTLQSEVQNHAKQIHSFCSAICDARVEICRIREDSISSLNEELRSVRLKFKRSANHTRREGFQNTYKEVAGSFFGYVNEFGGDGSYEKLRTLFSELMEIQIKESEWKTRDLLCDAKFIEFLSVIDDDDVEIEMEVGQAGFVPIQNLSAGQRCTAVFPILLRNSRGPLVIDQPEDNLDNRYIADVIAPDLLRKKETQQFIATSHNANLVVLTDADLIVHADSDGRIGTLERRGFFGCAANPIGSSVLDVLDGGERALLARQQKYGTFNNNSNKTA